MDFFPQGKKKSSECGSEPRKTWRKNHELPYVEWLGGHSTWWAPRVQGRSRMALQKQKPGCRQPRRHQLSAPWMIWELMFLHLVGAGAEIRASVQWESPEAHCQEFPWPDKEAVMDLHSTSSCLCLPGPGDVGVAATCCVWDLWSGGFTQKKFSIFILYLQNKILPGANTGSMCPPLGGCPVKWDWGLHLLFQVHPPSLRDRWCQTAKWRLHSGFFREREDIWQCENIHCLSDLTGGLFQDHKSKNYVKEELIPRVIPQTLTYCLVANSYLTILRLPGL